MSRTRNEIPHFLCDTWWYGMTRRITDKKFRELAELRSKQGFTAIQFVVGIPPEVGPENPNASSLVGPAWNLKGDFNLKYLEHSRKRIKILNSFGLTAIVYGAWGQQIEWLGENKMKDWWKKIIDFTNDLNVMYCVTGESDIWIGEEKNLLPNKSTDELVLVQTAPLFHPKIVDIIKKIINILNNNLNKSQKYKRHKKWSNILATVASLTNKPLFMHVMPNMTSSDAVFNSELLSAVTVQTGHSTDTREQLWRLPLIITQAKTQINFINLEPWYEGITDRFGRKDQIYAYWSSMMAGATAYCYGAHGIWNIGDGMFLSHWGKQTFNQAMKLATPRLIGLSHKLFINSKFYEFRNIKVEDKKGKLIKIIRFNEKGDCVCYVPDVTAAGDLPNGKLFSPVEGKFIKSFPKNGQIVIITSS